ncbi:hypothetical protein ZOSMA_4G00810 [Zostera marina]|uniref:FAR1 domain-containing protein n=1 Tax=Zostera marina TaxID=29655 RepID=A0A0K9P0N1_ZOSMR|nr:hypothetical protein ZOSMA_4G00810 [Zostera marina]
MIQTKRIFTSIFEIGKIFGTIDEAESEYYEQVGNLGFSVRKSTSRKIANEVVYKKYVCSKEGTSIIHREETLTDNGK